MDNFLHCIRYTICIAVVVSLSTAISAQKPDSALPLHGHTQSILKVDTYNKILDKNLTSKNAISIQPYRHDALFCRWESHLDKKSSLNFRFRLGSLKYTQHYEGKE